MPIDSLDNSLALGFYCRDHGEIIVSQTVAQSDRWQSEARDDRKGDNGHRNDHFLLDLFTCSEKGVCQATKR